MEARVTLTRYEHGAIHSKNCVLLNEDEFIGTFAPCDDRSSTEYKVLIRPPRHQKQDALERWATHIARFRS